jgi:hypothetical protein
MQRPKIKVSADITVCYFGLRLLYYELWCCQWVVTVLHRICIYCQPPSPTPYEFSSFSLHEVSKRTHNVDVVSVRSSACSHVNNNVIAATDELIQLIHHRYVISCCHDILHPDTTVSCSSLTYTRTSMFVFVLRNSVNLVAFNDSQHPKVQLLYDK